MICKPQRSCGYVADLGFYYWTEAGKKQMFMKGSLCQKNKDAYRLSLTLACARRLVGAGERKMQVSTETANK